MNELPLWLSIAVKAVFAATVVVSATAMAEKSGPLIAGLIIALPVSVGPTYVMLAFTASPQFVADSALGSIAANAGVAVFGTVYVLLAQRVPMPVSLVLALASWLATGWLAGMIDVSPAVLTAIATGSLLACTLLTGHARSGRKLLAGAKRRYDMPLRALFVGLFAGTLVTVSHAIGPEWTGRLAAFPLVFTTSVVLMHPRVGAAATAAVIASAIQGMVSYPCAFLLIYRFSVDWGKWWALLAWLLAIVAWGALVYAWRTSRQTAG